MGIEGLTKRLEQYKRRITFRQNEFDSPHAAVIDGPSLAHWVFSNTRGNDSAVIWSQACSYNDVCRAVVSFLDELTSYNIIVEAIIFDGALPSGKTEERRRRMQDELRSMKQQSDRIGNQSSRMVNTNVASRSSPPFLVPAVVEALTASRYKPQTFVVPGEADQFCYVAAQAGCENYPRVYVFSNDADFMVYSALSTMTLIPLRDLEEPVFDEDSRSLSRSGQQHNPFLLALFLSLQPPTLIEPIYWMTSVRRWTLKDAARMANRQSVDNNREFKEFAREFDTSPFVSPWHRLKHNNDQQDFFCSKDVRVLELMCQLKPSLTVQPPDTRELRVYLPGLTDDLSKPSAWVQGQKFRKWAYSILARAEDRDDAIFEYRRRGDSITAGRIVTLDLETVKRGVEASLKSLKEMQEIVSAYRPGGAMSQADLWRWFVMMQLLRPEHEGTPRTLERRVSQILTASRSSIDWDLVHLGAQYEARYYSVRMLKQALETYARRDPGFCRGARELLRTLPGIAEFFSPRTSGDGRPFSEEEWVSMAETTLGAWREGVGRIEREEEEVEEGEGEGEGEEQSSSSDPGEQSPGDAAAPAPELGNNMYSVLRF